MYDLIRSIFIYNTLHLCIYEVQVSKIYAYIFASIVYDCSHINHINNNNGDRSVLDNKIQECAAINGEA